MAKKNETVQPANDEYFDTSSLEINELLYARHAEIENLKQLTDQRGTPIPTLFSNFYKFIQNPSAISVDTFKRMVDTDDTIGGGTDFLTTCLAARIGAYKHPSKEITEWMNKRLEEIEGGWTNKIKEVLSATWAGFFTGEKCWANTEHGFVIEKIIPLPPTTVLFEVDRAGAITKDGILQYQRNWAPYGMGYSLNYFGGVLGSNGFSASPATNDPFAKLGDLPFPLRSANTFNYLSIRIPKQKCVHYAFDAQGKFDNPYGRSLLRRIYKYYVLKDAILRMLATALDRKGTPMLAVYVDPNVTLKDPRKVNQTTGARGKEVGSSAMDIMRDIFKNVHNDSVFILPGKKDSMISVDSISQDPNAEAFISALAMCDKAILRGLLIPALIFGSGDGAGSFALGETHQRTFDKICDGVNAGGEYVLLNQVVKEMLAYNFPKSAWQKDGLGEFTERELSTEERDKEMEVVEKAVNMGSVDLNDLNDLNQIRQKAGFSARTELIPVRDMFGLTQEEGGFEAEQQGMNNEEGGKAAPKAKPEAASPAGSQAPKKGRKSLTKRRGK